MYHVVKQALGEFVDVTWERNGSVTHRVTIEDTFTGAKEVFKFRSKDKAEAKYNEAVENA